MAHPSPSRRGAALLAAGLLLAPAGLRGAAAESDDGAPPPPADAPPAPARLSPDGLTAGPERGGVEASAEGRWRIRFAAGREDLPESVATRIEELGRRIAATAHTGRVTVDAQASGPVADVSTAHRVSLGRALAVKAALANGGLAATRIDLRPLGRTPEGIDAADIVPPPAAPGTAAP